MDIFHDDSNTTVELKLSFFGPKELVDMIKIYPCFIEDLSWPRVYFLRFYRYKKVTFNEYLQALLPSDEVLEMVEEILDNREMDDIDLNLPIEA